MSAIFDYINRLCRKIHHVTPETITDSISAITNPHSDVSIPLTRFIPKRRRYECWEHHYNRNRRKSTHYRIHIIINDT